MKIHTVIVCDDKWGIARNATLPFDLKKEKKFFHTILGDKTFLPPDRKNVMLMGRKSWAPIDPALPRTDAYRFLLSRTLKEKPAGTDGVVSSIDEFVALMESPHWKDKIGRIYNIGGGEISQCINQTKYCGRAYMSRVKGDFQCDTFCPNLDQDGTFKLVKKEFPYEYVVPEGIQREENGGEWIVYIYEKCDSN